MRYVRWGVGCLGWGYVVFGGYEMSDVAIG